jgi:glycosyltransferase involved in cell wall biosynthesis
MIHATHTHSGLRAADPDIPLTLSVVMPVYNEAETVGVAIERVLSLQIPDVLIELVVVESNSTDGSRDIVASYRDAPGVKVVLQDAARGKGNAVREGFERAAGSIILIQDADLEYSIDDYPALLEPIVDGRVDFTLGCRHVRGKPMRIMADTRVRASIVNAAHWVFLGMFNLTYGTRLRDPFTMYKVFRSECIDGVEFVSDRFDFDWELMAKLVRLGYLPLEVPVTYNARTFGEGKKVRFFRDPPTWVWACIRFRFCRLRRTRATVTSRSVAPRPSSLPARLESDDGVGPEMTGTRLS